MQKLNKLALNVKLVLVFFSAVFILSLVHFIVYVHLFNTMEQEESIINQQQVSSAKVQLDAAFSEIQAAYQEMNYDKIFLNLGSLEPETYKLVEMRTVAAEAYQNVPGIQQWFIVLRSTGQVLSINGTYDLDRYLDSFCTSQTYPLEFWEALMDGNFSRIILPEAEHTYLTTVGSAESKPLMPMVIRAYFNYNYTTVLLLDMDAIFKSADSYLGENMYLFSEDGTLLYTTDSIPLIDTIPTAEKFAGSNGIKYKTQQWTADNGIRCVKLQPVELSTDIVRSSFTVSLVLALSALLVIVALVPISIKSMLHPVNRMLDLLRQHGGPDPTGNIHSACEELEHILKTRDEQTAALAQRDATLSEYFLQSRMKNVYVAADQQVAEPDGPAYILYIQVQYHEICKTSFNMTRAELEACLQEMMSGVLSALFETTMIFQLEPGRFAARVTLPEGNGTVQEQMVKFMKRLDEEREFAWFTVVLSEPLTEEKDLAAVYTQVQEAARLARVCDTSQLLTLPMQAPQEPGFQFSRQDEQKLFSLIRSGDIPEAAAMTQQLLEATLKQGIDHSQMELLCIAIVNTVSYAMTELTPSAEKIAAASGVYNTLTSHCSTGQEYMNAVLDFIRAAAPSAKTAPDDQLLKGIQQYLEENYRKEFSGEEMAEALWVSRSHLSSYYKAKTGMNLSDSIQLFRIQKAVELLKDPNVKIGDVGSMVGIPSSNTFLRNFRKYTGMTPTEYRQKECK